MCAEYVRLSNSESFYGQKNLLQSQLELLDLIKRMRNFKTLRNQELVLKIALKNKVKEAEGMLESLHRILPVSHYKIDVVQQPKKREERVLEKEDFLSLQEEINEVQKKLARLQGRD